MAKSGTVTVKIAGDASGLEKEMGKVDGILGKVGKAAGVAMLAVGAAVGAAAVKGVLDFTAFEGQMNEVFSLLPGITEKAMGGMTDQVKNFATEFGVLPNEVVPALYESLSSGVPQDNVFAFMETAQKLAKGGVTDLTSAVNGLTSVTNAYGIKTLSAEKAADVMFTTVKFGKTTVEELSANLSTVIPAAAAAGVKFSDVGASIAALTAQGVPTAQATTQIRSAIVELTKGGTEADKVFRGIAKKSFPDFIKSGGDLNGALKLMEQYAKDNNLSMLDLFGSVEAGSAALALTGKGAEGFGTALKAMETSAGATDEAFQQMEKGLGPVIDKIKARVAVFFLDVGEKLAPIVHKAFGLLETAFAAVGDWWKANGPTIVAAVKAFVDKAGEVASNVIPVLRELVDDVLGALQKFWADHGDKIKDAIEAVGTAVDTIATNIGKAVTGIIDNWGKIDGPLKATGIIITTLLIPHFIALGVQATINAVKVAAAWVITQAAGLVAALLNGVYVLLMIAGWVLMGVQALIHAAKVVAGWLMTSAGAVAAVAVMIAQSAVFVAKWAWMGVQSLIHAAKIALAWIIALGPIAWLVAAVIAAVALIILNWDKIKTAVSAVIDWLGRNWPLVLAILTGPIGIAVLAIVRNWDTIKEKLGQAKDWVVEKFNAVVTYVKELPGKIASGAAGMWDSIKYQFKETINGVLRMWNDLRIPSFTFGGWDTPFGKTPSYTTPSIEFPNFRPLAAGGIVTRPTLAMIGEAGPEAVIPLSLMGSGSTTVRNYSITVTAIDPASAQEAVMRAIKEFERRNGSNWRN